MPTVLSVRPRHHPTRGQAITCHSIVLSMSRLNGYPEIIRGFTHFLHYNAGIIHCTLEHERFLPYSFQFITFKSSYHSTLFNSVSQKMFNSSFGIPRENRKINKTHDFYIPRKIKIITLKNAGHLSCNWQDWRNPRALATDSFRFAFIPIGTLSSVGGGEV